MIARNGDLRRWPGTGPCKTVQRGGWRRCRTAAGVHPGCAAPGSHPSGEGGGSEWAVDQPSVAANASSLGVLQAMAADAADLLVQRPDWRGRFERIVDARVWEPWAAIPMPAGGSAHRRLTSWSVAAGVVERPPLLALVYPPARFILRKTASGLPLFWRSSRSFGSNNGPMTPMEPCRRWYVRLIDQVLNLRDQPVARSSTGATERQGGAGSGQGSHRWWWADSMEQEPRRSEAVRSHRGGAESS